MSKLFIKNRDGLNVRVCVDLSNSASKLPLGIHPYPPQQKGLVFIMPGLGAHHNKPRFRKIAEIFTQRGYVAVSFDPTNSFGESDGDYADATFTNYYEDLEDVIEWSKTNLEKSSALMGAESVGPLYMEPFVLVGHSLGGMGVTLYAEKYPERVKALAPLSATISGKLSVEVRSKEEIEKWQTLGYQEKVHRSTGAVHKLKWSHMEDRLKYDNLPEAGKIKVPVLMIVGENDPVTPPKHQKLLFDALGTMANKKEMHVIAGAEHEVNGPEELPQVVALFENWVSKLD